MESSQDTGISDQLNRRIQEMTAAEKRNLLEQLTQFPPTNLSLGEREDTRWPYDQTVAFLTKNRHYSADCKDISSGGIFIKTDEVFQVGQLVILEIPFTSGAASIKIPAEIVRVSIDGIGLKFLKKENN